MSQPHPPNPYRQAIDQEIDFIAAMTEPGQAGFDEEEEVFGLMIGLIDKIKLIDNYPEQIQLLVRLHQLVLDGRLSIHRGPAAEAALIRAILEVPTDLTFDFRAWLNRRLSYALVCDRTQELYPGEAEGRLQTAHEFEPRATPAPLPAKTGFNWKKFAVDFLVAYSDRRRKPRS
ncbi:MAG TPA: hypothetical protein VFK03_02465 [Candidatus Saccharimonadales bacterium]|nr:hypothetical protein [Candidatus Saccharimonadales bacterium]